MNNDHTRMYHVLYMRQADIRDLEKLLNNMFSHSLWQRVQCQNGLLKKKKKLISFDWVKGRPFQCGMDHSFDPRASDLCGLQRP